jgi:hypothetical protein
MRPLGPLTIDQQSTSAAFVELLECLTTWAAPLLRAPGHSLADVGYHVFLSSAGTPWSDSAFRHRIPRLIEREMALMGRNPAHISWTMLRRVFVDGMRQGGSRGTDIERGAAMVMGNSTRSAVFFVQIQPSLTAQSSADSDRPSRVSHLRSELFRVVLLIRLDRFRS